MPTYPAKAMYKISGHQFYNTSEFTLAELLNDADFAIDHMKFTSDDTSIGESSHIASIFLISAIFLFSSVYTFYIILAPIILDYIIIINASVEAGVTANIDITNKTDEERFYDNKHDVKNLFNPTT